MRVSTWLVILLSSVDMKSLYQSIRGQSMPTLSRYWSLICHWVELNSEFDPNFDKLYIASGTISFHSHILHLKLNV